jgi:ElaB/YqjD/DUF883 family membrane-anchored ribosome-binding protein
MMAQEEPMAEIAFAKTVRAGEKLAESVCDVERAKATLATALDEGKAAARRVVKRGRHVVEDLEELQDTAVQRIRQHPRTTVAITFGLALGAGLLLGWLVGRARR